MDLGLNKSVQKGLLVFQSSFMEEDWHGMMYSYKSYLFESLFCGYGRGFKWFFQMP